MGITSAPHILMRGSKLEAGRAGHRPREQGDRGISVCAGDSAVAHSCMRMLMLTYVARMSGRRSVKCEVKVSCEPRAPSASCALLFLAVPVHLRCRWVYAYAYAHKADVGSRGCRRQTRHLILFHDLPVSRCMLMHSYIRIRPIRNLLIGS